MYDAVVTIKQRKVHLFFCHSAFTHAGESRLKRTASLKRKKKEKLLKKKSSLLLVIGALMTAVGGPTHGTQ